jgi:3-(3-hydroxy-phenyl)propionate hydroxylase
MSECGWTTSGYKLPVFASVIPEAARRHVVERVKLAIVGGGLTGLTLAADLTGRGIGAILLDDDNTVGVRGASSRGMVWVRKTLEVMDRLGVADRMMEKGIIWWTGKTLSGNDVVHRLDHIEDNGSKLPPFLNLQQFYVEWYLVERIQELGLVELRWNNKVTGIRQGESSVQLDVKTNEGAYTIEADWVIDASGAHSPIRTAMELNTNAARHDDRWCICDVRCTDINLPERRVWVDAPFNKGRAVWQHMMADGVWRLDYQLDADTDGDVAAEPDTASKRVRAHLGPDIAFEFVWIGVWTYRELMLDNFRVGHVLFAGDAAHIVSPFGGRGGNSGVQDADNLGWKLALVLTGQADEALLDTYDSERRPAAVENRLVTSRTNRFIAPKTPFERRLRQAVLSLAREHTFARPLVNTGRLAAPQVYANSSILLDGGGYSIPNVRLRKGSDAITWLADEVSALGTGSLGLYAPKPGADFNRAAITAVASESLPYHVRSVDLGEGAEHCNLIDSEEILRRVTGLQAGDLAVIRPDLYCAGVVRAATAASADQALATSVGRGR